MGKFLLVCQNPGPLCLVMVKIALVQVYSWLHGDKDHSDLIPFQEDAHLPVLRNDHIDQFLGTNMDQGIHASLFLGRRLKVLCNI